jgi:FAD/FMN-containing dehydrogenase
VTDLECRQALKNAIGPDKVKDDEISLVTYASDSVPGVFRKPDFVVLPESSEDIRKILLLANDRKIPITVMSAGLNVAALTIPPEHGIVMDLRRMNKIVEINTDSGYAVVEPGVTFHEFCAALRQVGFRCHITTAPASASVVGNYLSRSSGTFCTRHLDSIVDLEVAFPDGSLVKTGANSFPGAGRSLRYGPGPDLTGMFCMGHGTLGVVTSASVRIYPNTESNRLMLVTFDSYKSALFYSREVSLNNLAEHCLIYSWRMWFDGYAKGTMALKAPPPGMPYCAVSVRIAGFEESVAANEKVCTRLAEKHGGKVCSDEEASGKMVAFAMLKDWYLKCEPLTFPRLPKIFKDAISQGRDEMGVYLPWIVMAEPKNVIECEKWASEKITGLGLGVPAYYSQLFDYGRSIFLRFFVYPDARNKDLHQTVKETYNAMYAEALERYGATPFRARGVSPWLDNAGEFRGLFMKLKSAVDPNNILTPQLLGEK